MAGQEEKRKHKEEKDQLVISCTIIKAAIDSLEGDAGKNLVEFIQEFYVEWTFAQAHARTKEAFLAKSWCFTNNVWV